MKQLDKIFYIMGLIIIGGLICTSILQGTGLLRLTELGFPCSFKQVTGLPCPGCGGTRAVCFLAEGNLWQSFQNHPFVVYTGLGFILYILWNTIALMQHALASKLQAYHKRKDSVKMPIWHFSTVYIYIGIAIIFIQWGIKLFQTFTLN